MKFKMPSKANKSLISECMSVTMKNRRKWILEKLPSIDEIFNLFPRLGDYYGQMVSNNALNLVYFYIMLERIDI